MVDRVAQVVALIKAKKELSTLDDAFVREKVDRILRADATIQRKLDAAASVTQFSRSASYEDLLKRVRKELRTVYGVFQSGDRDALLKKLSSGNEDKVVDDVLETHVSTKERVPFYLDFTQGLAKHIIPAPNIIIDLGCGMNPLAHRHYVKAGWDPSWVASDVSAADMQFLAHAFKELGIKGKTSKIDLLSESEKVAKLKGDVTFLLKLLDSLEESKRHISYKLFDNITTPWIVASFPTKSLGGRKGIATAGRTWFERLLKRKDLKWETFSIPNELVYVIKRS